MSSGTPSSPPKSSSNSKLSIRPRTMTSALKGILARLTPNASSTDLSGTGFRKAPKGQLFPQTNPVEDGEECLHDCASCTIRLPSKWSIDETEELYGHIKGWSRHLIVATGKTDWVRDVADEKGSVMEAVEAHKSKHNKGRLMLSASNIPVPEAPSAEGSTSCLLLPAFTVIDNVTPASTPDLINHIINAAPTNTDALGNISPDSANPITPPELNLKTRPCPHRYLILLCSQRTRDARCGQSAPLLRREFERHLRPLGLHRDLHDERPGGVGIYFISHVGGHKFSANVLIYRRADAGSASAENATAAPATPDSADAEPEKAERAATDGGAKPVEAERMPTDSGAAQCIWLARVRPEDCENIVRYTVLQGKVVKPDRQLRGGFDRGRQLTSW